VEKALEGSLGKGGSEERERERSKESSASLNAWTVLTETVFSGKAPPAGKTDRERTVSIKTILDVLENPAAFT
jgi:hypothetical protein